MLLRTAIQEINALRFMIDQLDIQSGLGKRMLMESPFMTQPDEIEAELNEIELFAVYIKNTAYKGGIKNIQFKLSGLKDLRGTIIRLKDRGVLDDIELFELKSLALLNYEINALKEDSGMDFFPVLDLKEIIALLDPENTHIPHFYIYDCYSERLAKLRKEIKALQSNAPENEKAIEQLYSESIGIEDEIRKELCEKIVPFIQKIETVLWKLGRLDILLAKAVQAVEMDFCKPEISTETTTYHALFNPQIKSALQADKKNFQPIDLKIEKCASLITGANMTGKSVILKTAALAQALFQFGFFIPAKKATICPVEEIIVSMGDEQNELTGLSSYAAEMLKINSIINKVKEGKNLLVLIDELARTTNPTEGKAIVNAVVDFLTEYKVRSLITTHYSGINSACKKLRVKGFIKKDHYDNLNIQTINNYIDYSLIEEQSEESVPQEAIYIASVLGVDKGLLDKARLYLKN